MRVHVTFLAPLRYQLGVSEFEFEDAHDELGSEEFLAALHLRLPRLGSARGDLARGHDEDRWTLVCNDEIQRAAFVVKDGDKLKFLGPLSGG